MKTLIVALLSLCLATPAFAWRPYGPICYPRPYYYRGVNPGAAAGVAGAALVVGALAGLLIGAAVAGRNQAELNMLDSAGRANMYENYLTALSYYNANTRSPVAPFSRDQWLTWRAANGLEALR
jgi:hypothetical protein